MMINEGDNDKYARIVVIGLEKSRKKIDLSIIEKTILQLGQDMN